MSSVSLSLTPLAKANLVAHAREMTQTPAELAADIVTLAVNTMGIVPSAHATGLWIEWNGGQSPVEPASVEIRRRNGTVSTEYVENIRWNHELSPFDVVAYRQPADSELLRTAHELGGS